MFDSEPIVVGLEIGTSKVCAVVGELLGEGAGVNIVAVGQSPSQGVRKGEIRDVSDVEECVRRAIAEAEEMANVEIRSVYLGVTGGHIRGFNNRGVHPIPSADREITSEDVQDVIKNAKAINLPHENTVLHAIRQHFLVDGQDGVTDPVGMVGSCLEVDMHVVHGNLNRIQNPIRLVRGLQLEVEEVVFTGLAASLALLTNEQKELGALVIDLGGGTTDYAVYADGVIKHTGVLAVGGDHVTQDLALGLTVPISLAERLKLEHGGAFVDEEVKGRILTLPSEHGFTGTAVNLENLRRIMHLRLEETLDLVAQDVDNAGLLPHLRAGVVLCGGGARVPGLTRLAEQVFKLPVTVGHTTAISGLKSTLDQPEFAAPLGLVKFAALKARSRTERRSGWHRVKRFFSEVFSFSSPGETS
ncbi:MAG: cell division protein FtsA [Verrucomicrobiae bacterium]|nr:cell division protein FtsA [Verrucomicrobiae bacterium]MDW8308990.1 cell division protein FtsA [Verrucomicrobiales bacterium]